MYPLWQVALVSILPGLLWLWFFYRQDAFEPEPKWLLLSLFGLGMLSVLPALWVESPWRGDLIAGLREHNLARLTLLSYILVGGVEEAAKLAVLFFTVHRLAEFDEPLDGVVYGVTVGLGFAALENLLYAAGHGPAVGLFRAAVTSLAHASFTGWLGYFLTVSRFSGRQALILYGYLIAVALHGTYDLILFWAVGLSALFSFLLVGMTMLLLLRKMRELELVSPFRPPGG
ncbi:MAG: PrsW family intramembrane metalloprotease [Bacteroidota bacterium]